MYLVPYAGAERKRERPRPERTVVAEPIKIIKEVCKAHGVTLPRVRSYEFDPKLLLARRECVYRLRNELGLSWRQIGALMWRDRKACACLWDRVNDSLG